jgi:aryl-alcohol dehydrogenase-like predicted oxidoreductase
MIRKMDFGKTGMKVTQLGYGALEVRGVSSEDPRARLPNAEAAGRILNAVLDSGINFIDTAWCYGRSEEMIGKYISNRRSEYFLAAKTGHGHCSASKYASYKKQDLIDCFEESLRNIKTDYVDFLQLHNPTAEDVEAEGAIEQMQKFKEQGKARFIGVSSVIPHLDKHLATGAWQGFQLPYSALEPEHHDMLTKLSKAGCGTVIRGGVAKGEPESKAALENRRFSVGGKRWDVFEQTKLDELREEGESRTAFLLRFTMSHPHVHTTIVGTQNPDHLKENVAAAEKGPLPQKTYDEAKKRLADIGLKHGG